MTSRQIQLAQAFHLSDDCAAATRINQPHLHSLLAYLLTNHRTPLLRQRVAFIFWPDATPSHIDMLTGRQQAILLAVDAGRRWTSI